ncbi:Dbl homology domain-containing protein [Trametes sanguinea]|nr:Dbl homology domain-containing protein [Trametes sanguinea]
MPVSDHDYEDAPTSPPQVVVHEASSSWRSTLSDDVYLSLSRHYGPVEMERQELIFSLYASEQSFAKSARYVVRNVLLPLRARDSRAWLPGLPPDVTRFFDWLEDVVNLHASIVHALSSVTAIWQTGSIVQRLAATLKGFVPRFEVYMPYLVKYESMREALRWHSEQDDGEFGEYLRLQERDRQEGTWSLDKLFTAPAQRLRSYLDVFQVSGP